jgi:hypothetical protein
MKLKSIGLVSPWLAMMLHAGAQSGITHLSGADFSNPNFFQAQWNYLYPSGSDHNGHREFANPAFHLE